MENRFDSPEELIGDEGIFISSQAKALNFLSSVFKTALFPPQIPMDSSLTPTEQWQQICAETGKEWWDAWQTLSNQSLSNYIQLISFLPELLIDTPWLNRANKGTLPYKKIENRHLGITVWMLCFTQANLSARPEWENFRPYGLEAKGLLDLCTAVYQYKARTSVLHGYRNLFTSSEHLWFWCIVARCIRSLRDQGLMNPHLSEHLKSKQTILAEEQIGINALHRGELDLSHSACKGWEDLMEHLDLYVAGEAIQGGYVESDALDPLENYVRVRKHTQNIFRRSKKYQLYVLYQFPKDNTIRTFSTEQGLKLPKPRRKRKQSSQ